MYVKNGIGCIVWCFMIVKVIIRACLNGSQVSFNV